MVHHQLNHKVVILRCYLYNIRNKIYYYLYLDFLNILNQNILCLFGKKTLYPLIYISIYIIYKLLKIYIILIFFFIVFILFFFIFIFFVFILFFVFFIFKTIPFYIFTIKQDIHINNFWFIF